jgi:hypothetical protein
MPNHNHRVKNLCKHIFDDDYDILDCKVEGEEAILKVKRKLTDRQRLTEKLNCFIDTFLDTNCGSPS